MVTSPTTHPKGPQDPLRKRIKTTRELHFFFFSFFFFNNNNNDNTISIYLQSIHIINPTVQIPLSSRVYSIPCILYLTKGKTSKAPSLDIKGCQITMANNRKFTGITFIFSLLTITILSVQV